MIGRAKVKPSEEPVALACNGCGAHPPEPMETRVVEGIALLMCTNPTVCRRRAQKAGRWEGVFWG